MCAATTLSIGTFDGVHRGHRRLLDRARALVGRRGRVVAMAFDPHPLTVLRPNGRPDRLTTFEQRSEYLREAGADDVIRLEPTAELLGRSPQQFIADVVAQFQPSAIVEGPDFRFGKGRAGDVDTLRQLGAEFGFRAEIVEPSTCVLTDTTVIRASSSMLRWFLGHGRVRDAAIVCGRPHELWGSVVEGDRRGRDLDMPTANLRPDGDVLLPGDGIYAGAAVRPDGSVYPAAISIGTKPTFGEHPRVCEAHLIGFDGPLDDYGWRIRLRFMDWLRDQVRYDSVDQLVEQLQRDCAAAAAIAESRARTCPPWREFQHA